MRRVLVVAVVAVIALAACGKETATLSQPTPSAEPGLPAVTGAAGSKPVVTIPDATPPTTLVTRDVIAGTGAEAVAGSQVFVQYVGINWSNKQQFDASWDRGAQPFDFPLGAGRVITGWDEGVAGMKVGGRRLLVIPPDKGYGPGGAPPDIPPNETLVFVVDLIDVAPAS